MDFRVAGGLFGFGDRLVPCAIGRGGLRRDKREGDGATPIGIFPLRRVLFRPDRLTLPPATLLPVTPLTPLDGWCDDPGHADYNRFVTLPHPARCERLWREDGLYDLLAVIGHNDSPPVAGLGSAIFLHVAGATATEGCVALALDDLVAALALAGPASSIGIEPV